MKGSKELCNIKTRAKYWKTMTATTPTPAINVQTQKSKANVLGNIKGLKMKDCYSSSCLGILQGVFRTTFVQL